MTPIALMRALVRMGESVRRTYTRRPLGGRQFDRLHAMWRSRWVQQGLGKNRHARRAEGWKGDHKEVIAAIRNMGVPNGQ